MSGLLLDTNVVSELRKRDRMDPRLRAWWADNRESQLWLSVLVLGELRRGVELLRRRDDTAAQALDSWLAGLVEEFAAAPFVWMGTADEIAADLHRFHERWRISSYVVRANAMDAAHEVLAKLRPRDTALST